VKAYPRFFTSFSSARRCNPSHCFLFHVSFFGHRQWQGTGIHYDESAASSHCMDPMTSRTYGVAAALIIVFLWSLLLGSDLPLGGRIDESIR